MEDLFQKATRLKLRWQYKGICSVEDLWDLHEETLNSIYEGLSMQYKNMNVDSLLEKQNEKNQTLVLKIEIVKYIFGIKQTERKKSSEAMLKAARKQKLLGLLAQKEGDSLLLKSPEEIQAMIEEL